MTMLELNLSAKEAHIKKQEAHAIKVAKAHAMLKNIGALPTGKRKPFSRLPITLLIKKKMPDDAERKEILTNLKQVYEKKLGVTDTYPYKNWQTSTDLMNLFAWRDTPQGRDYWVKFKYALNKL